MPPRHRFEKATDAAIMIRASLNGERWVSPSDSRGNDSHLFRSLQELSSSGGLSHLVPCVDDIARTIPSSEFRLKELFPVVEAPNGVALSLVEKP